MRQNKDMPKIIGDTLADHRELTRHRLFDALSDLLTEQPFDSITMSQIAQRAEVGRTAVYNHFADKESLLLEYMTRTTAQFADVLQQALDGETDPIEQIRIYIRAYLELKERFHLIGAVDLKAHVSDENSPHLRDHAGIVEHVLFHILEGAMRSGVIPTQNSLALVTLIHSSLAGQYLPTDDTEHEDAIRLAQAFALRGIGVSSDIVLLPPPSSAPSDGSQSVPPLRHDAQAFLRCPVNRR